MMLYYNHDQFNALYSYIFLLFFSQNNVLTQNSQVERQRENWRHTCVFTFISNKSFFMTEHEFDGKARHMLER